MILLCGIASEGPVALVRDELDRCGAPYVVFHQRRFAESEMWFELAGGALNGELRIAGSRYRLDDFSGVYTRLMDDQRLPELWGEPPESPARAQSRAIHDALSRWCELAPGRVVNRAASMSSNFSKPYQAQVIAACGFDVPDTLITNVPDLVLDFRRRHPTVVYKSISGVRSIVQFLRESDLQRLDHIRWCPTQFQEYVTGTDVRVHTVGAELFATAIRTDAADYRYAHRAGTPPVLEATTIDDDVADRCVRLASKLGLAFAGIDLKVAPDSRVYCFEVNPSPAFSYYQQHTGQPIARAVARYLLGEGDG